MSDSPFAGPLPEPVSVYLSEEQKARSEALTRAREVLAPVIFRARPDGRVQRPYYESPDVAELVAVARFILTGQTAWDGDPQTVIVHEPLPTVTITDPAPLGPEEQLIDDPEQEGIVRVVTDDGLTLRVWDETVPAFIATGHCGKPARHAAHRFTATHSGDEVRTWCTGEAS